jgi:hypothetical protein
VYSQSYISQDAVSHNDGYPASWWSNKPSNHQMNQPYGQLAACTATGFEWPFDGVASYYRTPCDMSGGHSGSPNWTDYVRDDQVERRIAKGKRLGVALDERICRTHQSHGCP